jgi:isopenicillin-N N-acyltransferase-like protein
MTPATRFPELEVAGPPLELGRQVGEAARDRVRAFCDFARERAPLAAGTTRERALQVAADSIAHVARYQPAMLEEIEGIAQGAGVSVQDVLLLQVRNQLQPDLTGGCTSFALAATDSAGRGSIVAQNWDNDPDLDPFTVVLTRRPTGKPALMTLGRAGLIAT